MVLGVIVAVQRTSRVLGCGVRGDIVMDMIILELTAVLKIL